MQPLTRNLLPATLLLSLLATPALAFRQRINERIDHALYPKHDPKTVVVGRITAVTSAAPVPAKGHPLGEIDLSFNLDFHVDAVLFGNLKNHDLSLRKQAFAWPTTLVPLKAGEYCILILQGHGTIATVIPATPGKFTTATTYNALLPVLRDQLLAQLAAEKTAVRQFRLLEELGPILTKDHVKQVEPLLASKDPWVRRAARAAIIWAAFDPKRIDDMHHDIDAFFDKPQAPVNTLEPRRGYNPDFLFFNTYFFLNCNWSTEEDARKTPLLPTFRKIALDARISPDDRWDHGYDPLCHLGTREDAKTLWDCYTTTDQTFRKEAFHFASNRQSLLLALSRLYDLNLSNWSEDEFPKKEPEQAEAVRQALIQHKVLPPE